MMSRRKSDLFELVVATTPDFVRLHGLFQISSQRPSHLPLDAVIILHGLGGNFYSSKLNLRLADTLLELGVSIVLANTRGHDGISMNTVSGRAQTIGAAYEIVDDCRHDVRGWVNWLTERGYNKIGLVGHSLGAIKSLYAQAYEPQDNVKAIIGLSATRLSHERFLNSPSRDRFLHWFGQAQMLVDDGSGKQLLNVDFPFPTFICAESYTDKYGPADRYNWTKFANKIGIPTCLLFGELELRDNPAFHGLLDDARAVVNPLSNFHLEVIPSADHFYAGVHHRASDAITRWFNQL